MEKVIVATGNYPLNTDDMREVNAYLARGWSVKSVTVQNSKNHMTAIYVLEIGVGEGIVGTYSANALWDGQVDQLVLCNDKTYKLTTGLYNEVGKWEQIGNNVVITPDCDSAAEPRTICLREDGMGFFIGGRFFSR